jgi:hypothetical protein
MISLPVDSRVVSGELLKRGQQWVIDYVGILTFNKISVIGRDFRVFDLLSPFLLVKFVANI